MQHTSQSGFAAAALGVVVAAVTIGALAVYFLVLSQKPVVPVANAPTTTAPATNFPATSLAASPAAAPAAAPVFTGIRLAGTSAPLLDFNPADFAAAQKSNKLIVLYFYANWCPECRVEFPKMQAAFNQITSDQVVGFRVNYNDNETDAAETALAREHGIAYQHTKVFVQADQQTLKSPETWETARYLAEINKALGQ